ncbi:MAG TPA: DUF6152 family protein [Sphingobium sp.]|nr:DUF6152 family protein [Sphingobium sp.]
MVRFLSRLALLPALATLTLPATAHHSTAMFHWGTEVGMKNATVERWEWTNPHTFLYVQVPIAGGRSERWAFEGMSPNHLTRTGWSKRTLKPGDKITLTYYSLKDGRKGGFNVSVTLPNGQTLRQLGSPSDSPAKDS